MLIICKVQGCPYNSNNNYLSNNYCLRPHMVGIDQQGMCNQIWKNGQPKPQYQPFDDKNYPKAKIEIMDVAENELSDGDKDNIEGKEELGQRGE